MKFIAIALIAILFISCQEHVPPVITTEKVVVTKVITIPGSALSSGTVKTTFIRANGIRFQEYCSLYNVGDTVIATIKTRESGWVTYHVPTY